MNQKLAQKNKLIITLKKTEATLIEKYKKIFEDASAKQRQVIENMKNERLGLLNQIHMFKKYHKLHLNIEGDDFVLLQFTPKIVKDRTGLELVPDNLARYGTSPEKAEEMIALALASAE